ncbi:MAG: hypothetical protein HQK50_07770 [Oligoflexia bacterium]|nr:hypothetical protein [Oligoflexia bacterium]MBF0365454.1 hypothetical protein [Oligoflexia bacterium]
MERVYFLEHKTIPVLFTDYKKASIAEILHAYEDAKKIIAKQPPASLLILSDFTNAEIAASLTLMEATKSYLNHNRPYVKFTAIIGMAKVAQTIGITLIRATGRNNVVFLENNDQEEALEFLVQKR